jgi:hypothetical protein
VSEPQRAAGDVARGPQHDGVLVIDVDELGDHREIR